LAIIGQDGCEIRSALAHWGYFLHVPLYICLGISPVEL
jgi:hypothetical protein